MEEDSPKGESPRRGNGNGSAGMGAHARFELDELRLRAEELKRRLTGLIKERPIAALLVAAGAGYLVGRILRA